MADNDLRPCARCGNMPTVMPSRRGVYISCPRCTGRRVYEAAEFKLKDVGVKLWNKTYGKAK